MQGSDRLLSSWLRRSAALVLLTFATMIGLAACGDSAKFTTTGCLPKESDGTCPTQEQAKKHLPNLEDCSGIDSVTDGPTVTQDAVPCCYHYVLEGCKSH